MLKRRISAATGLMVVGASVAILATACLPSRPNDRPLALTVRDGEVVFAWCGSASEPFRYLAIDYRVFDADEEFVRAAEGSGEYRFVEGEEFSTKVPPTGVQYDRSKAVPITSDRTLIFVFPGRSASNLAPWSVTFDVADLASLDSSDWLHPSGEVTASPCE